MHCSYILHLPIDMQMCWDISDTRYFGQLWKNCHQQQLHNLPQIVHNLAKQDHFNSVLFHDAKHFGRKYILWRVIVNSTLLCIVLDFMAEISSRYVDPCWIITILMYSLIQLDILKDTNLTSQAQSITRDGWGYNESCFKYKLSNKPAIGFKIIRSMG